MLPEILPVHIEGGGETLVPLTPITTFKDVSACVRDPGDPLPLILEDSPLGLRVVAGWERPLELLRLWGNMREQVRYSASFTLSHQLRYDLNNSNRPLMRSATPDSMNYNNNIDPWELYELKDELKGLQNMIYTNKTSDPSWNLFRKVSQNDVDQERVENLDKENDANVNNTEDIFGTTFNSHTNDNWHKQKPWRNAMNEEMQNKHLQSLLHESKMASMYGSPFRRGSMPTRSLPHHKEVKDRSYVVKNESYSPSPYKKYKSNSVFVEDLTKLKNPKIVHYRNINSSLNEGSNLKENYQFYRAGNENGVKIYKGNPQEYSPGSFQEENSDHVNLKPKQKSYIPSTFNTTNVISNSDNSDFMFHNGQSYQRQSKITCLAPTAHNWVKMSMIDDLKNSNSSSKNKSLEDETQFNQFSKPSDKDSPPKTSYSFLPKILSSKSKQHSGQTSSSDITNNITNKNGEICNGQNNGSSGSSFKNKWKSSSDKTNSKIIPMKGVNFKQQNLHPQESKSENENLNRNKYPERDKVDQNRFFGGSSVDSKSSSHSKSPMNHSTKDGIFHLNLKKKTPEISSPIIGLLSERNIMEKPKKSISKPGIFKPPLQSFKSGFFNNSAKSSSTTKPSFTSEKPNQSTSNVLNHTFNFNNSHSDLSSSTTSSSLSSRTNYSNDRLRYNSHSQHATSPSSMSSESDRTPNNPSRKSRSLKRNTKADHRRSYSDPVSEYWQESQKYSNCNPGRIQRRRRHSGGFPANNAGMKDTQLHLTQIPDGGEVTLSELREMATRQQHQIESQQQLLVAREQRLKYLKQQEGRSAQISLEAERLRRLRERVEAQEAKLRRLRALRGQVDSSLLNAASLSSDLEAMRLLFSEKEKELVDAASKVEELTKQLEDVRSGRGGAVIHQNGTAGTNINNTQNHHFQIHHQELDKLRRELLYRNSVNREASTRVASQKEALSTRKDEIARIDKRIAELQQRLYRKRFLNQQLASQISAATQAKQAQLKAVQQKAKREGNKDNSLDDITTDERRTIEDIAHFERGAQDPKYQTLPYNTKFSSGNKEGSQCINSGTSLGPPQTSTVPNCGSNVVTRTVHSIPTHLPSKGHASAPLTSGSSVVAGSTASHTVPIPSPQMSHPATSSLNRGHQNGSLRPNYLHQQQQTSHLPLYSSKIPQSDDSNSNKQLQSQQTIHNGSSLQDQRANLPPTSLSVSFSQKHNNQSIAANGQPRSTPLSNSHQCSLQPVNKDVENVRALGFTPGGSNSSVPGVKSMSSTNGASVSVDESSREASTGSVKIKPSLPPKPSPHSKPTPPPRQKGDPLAGSTESLNLTGVTRNNSQSRPQVFRYASQNVILSTYTQQQQQQQQSSQEQKPQSLQSEPKQIDSKQQQDSQSAAQFQQSSNSGNSTLSQQYKEAKQLLSNETGIEPKEASIKDNNEATGEKVHVSISRRIEIPPDFLFPEDATPPSDLIGRPLDDLSKTGGSSSSDSGYDAPDKIHNINNNDIITKNNTNNINKNNSSNSVSINNNNNNNNSNLKSVNNFNTINNVTSTLNDIERLKVSTNAESQTQEVRKKHQKLNVNVEDLSEKELNEETNEKGEEAIDDSTSLPTSTSNSLVVRRLKKGNLKTPNSSRAPRRVSFDPLALLLDASLEGELELVKRTATEVTNPSAANDEGITALHNAICAGHLDIVTFLVTFGCDVNAQDSDGWTPLHCAASCNNVAMVRFLVEHGACVLATTLSDHETAAEKCEQDEEGYDGCSQYLYSVQEKLGIMNGGVVYAVYDYDAQNDDELNLKCSDRLTILRRGDEYEPEWWWAKNEDKKPGYVPRNLLGLYPRVKNIFKDPCP